MSSSIARGRIAHVISAKALTLSAALALTAGGPAPVQATTASILGTATGTYSLVNSGCIDSADDGPNSGSVSITFNDQAGTSFAGVGTATDADGPSSLQVSGSLLGTQIYIYILATAADGTQSAVSGSGTYVSPTIDFTFSGSDIVGDTCSILDGIATLSFGTGAFVPSESTPIEGTITRDNYIAARTNAGILAARFNDVRRGKQGLSRVASLGQGIMLSGSYNGAAAGGGWTAPLGMWASYVRSDSKDDFVSTASKSTRNTVFAGTDIQPWDNALIGIALGFEDGSTRTRFNDGKEKTTGFTLAPYFGWFISDLISFDLSGGYTDLSITQYRTTATGAQVNSDPDSARWFANGNVSLTYQTSSLLFTGTTGLLWARQTVDSYREDNDNLVGKSSSNLGQFRIGGELAYLAGAFEPYVNATYSYDFTRTRINFAPGVTAPNNDDDDVQLGAGLRYIGSNGLSGSLEYSTILSRSNYDEDVFSATVRWNF
jgi:hypothetical protein